MGRLKFAALLLASLISSGCASGLNSFQQQEYAAMQSSNLIVEEKDPSTGAWLGLLPGGGSFYARHPGYGIANLLFWPLSILWDPVSGYEGSKVINYNVSVHKIKKDKQKELILVENKHIAGEIDSTQYMQQKRIIEAKYDF